MRSTSARAESVVSQGLFYMEKQLEDFIIRNWNRTALGKKYDLLIEDGELVSQQYRARARVEAESSVDSLPIRRVQSCVGNLCLGML